jgi:hypothetical protein
VLVGTAWPQFAAADPVAVAEVVANPLIIDACQGISADRWRAGGWNVAAPFPTSNRRLDAASDLALWSTGPERR